MNMQFQSHFTVMKHNRPNQSSQHTILTILGVGPVSVGWEYQIEHCSILLSTVWFALQEATWPLFVLFFCVSCLPGQRNVSGCCDIELMWCDVFACVLGALFEVALWKGEHIFIVAYLLQFKQSTRIQESYRKGEKKRAKKINANRATVSGEIALIYLPLIFKAISASCPGHNTLALPANKSRLEIVKNSFRSWG